MFVACPIPRTPETQNAGDNEAKSRVFGHVWTFYPARVSWGTPTAKRPPAPHCFPRLLFTVSKVAGPSTGDNCSLSGGSHLLPFPFLAPLHTLRSQSFPPGLGQWTRGGKDQNPWCPHRAALGPSEVESTAQGPGVCTGCSPQPRASLAPSRRPVNAQ